MKRFIILSLSVVSFCLITFSQAVISVDTLTEYQAIEGFGGFGAKKVWWDNGPYWDQEYVDQVIDNLGCSFIRTQIYWESEAPNDDSDPDNFYWPGFRFGADNDNNGKQMSFLKAVGDKGVRILATVWTPPIWMKGLEEFFGTYNGNPQRRRPSPAELNAQCAWCGGAGGCTQVGGRLKPEFYEEFAEYLAAYVKSVKQKTGHDVWAISIQNEPMFPNPFESCVVLPEEYAEILKITGKKFEREGITTRLFGPEHMGEWSWGMNRDYIRKILGNPEVNPYLSFYAVHSYVDGIAPDYGSAEGWSILRDSISTRYGKQLWMTETSDFEKKGYELAFSMAKSLYLALKFGQISGWIYWTIADYVIKENKLTKLGYAFKNYYRFIKPGSIHVASNCSDESILVTAFKKSGDLTLVIINNSGASKQVVINLLNASETPTLYIYRTSENENCNFAGYVRNSPFYLPAQSITTLTSGINTSISRLIPATDEIIWEPAMKRLRIDNNKEGFIKITDSAGRTVYNMIKNSNQCCVYLNSLNSGFYIVTFITQKGCLFNKIIIHD
ncbi:MAG: T9SS type A sorting domain-containing protein [Bacteroidales bacterium]